MAKITLFAQILQHLPKDEIKKVIRKHGTDKHSKGCDTWTHLVSMIFCQFADCVSLRDIAAGMRSASGNLNHLGVEEAPSKSTLGYQNKNRVSDVFRDIYYTVLSHLGQQVRGGKRIHGLKTPVKLLDSTLVTLCMEIYDWALYTHTKGAVKLHTLLDFATFLPEYVYITDGKGADSTSAREVRVTPHCIVVADRGYCDFGLLHDWDSSGGLLRGAAQGEPPIPHRGGAGSSTGGPSGSAERRNNRTHRQRTEGEVRQDYPPRRRLQR